MRACGNTLAVLLAFHTLRLTQAVSNHVPGGYGISGDGKNTPMDSARSPPPASKSLHDAIGGQNGSPSLPTKSHSRGISARDNDPCYVEPYSGPGVIDVTFPPFDAAAANVYRYRQQQSVNLGSWFVQESWMVPSLFACASGKKISELDVANGWGSTTASRALLENHWDTFITREDFQYLAGIGINTVRLPIGYWSLGPDYCKDTPFAAVADVYEGSWSRVVRAIKLAGDMGIGVLVDLHGAVGSQNGQDHSGISDGATNLFNDPANIDKTIAALSFLMQQLGRVTNVVGIQILNEPRNVPSLPEFYTRAITAMRQIPPADPSFPLYLHDGFDLNRFSKYVANRTDFVVQDHHSYFVFTPSDEAEPASQHTADVKGGIRESLYSASALQRRNLVVDEWSCALTDQSLDSESDPAQARKDFGTAQMEAYANATAGWSFWSYKKEHCDDDPGWCFKAAVGKCLPTTFFSYRKSQTATPTPAPSIPSAISQMNSGSASRKRAHPRARLTPIHERRQQAQGQPPNAGLVLPGTKFLFWDGASQQRSIAKGYSDGFLTAKMFAMQGTSKLGFIGQYIINNVRALGPDVVAPGTEGDYEDGFVKGLEDGKMVVASAMNGV